MLNPLDVLRRHRSPDAIRYSHDEVLAIMRGEQDDQRAQEVLEVVAATSGWLPGDLRRAFGNLAWYAERLPTILYLYRRGWAPEQIGRRLSPLGGAWAVNRTLETAAELVAERLNKRPLAA